MTNLNEILADQNNQSEKHNIPKLPLTSDKYSLPGEYIGRILIVDDEFNILRLLEKLFRKRGWMVYTAYNSELGEKITDQFEVDVVIADYKLADSNGLDFLNKLRKKKPWIKGIVLTGYKEALSKSIYTVEGSIYPFIDKSCNTSELLEWAETMLQISRGINRT